MGRQRAASQACGRQWGLRLKAQPRQVTHSLRGNLKDLLRDVGVSKELNHYITGHGQRCWQTIKAAPIAIRYGYQNKVEHPWIQPHPLRGQDESVSVCI